MELNLLIKNVEVTINSLSLLVSIFNYIDLQIHYKMSGFWNTVRRYQHKYTYKNTILQHAMYLIYLTCRNNHPMITKLKFREAQGYCNYW
jgi:hypothetical protein